MELNNPLTAGEEELLDNLGSLMGDFARYFDLDDHDEYELLLTLLAMEQAEDAKFDEDGNPTTRAKQIREILLGEPDHVNAIARVLLGFARYFNGDLKDEVSPRLDALKPYFVNRITQYDDPWWTLITLYFATTIDSVSDSFWVDDDVDITLVEDYVRIFALVYANLLQDTGWAKNPPTLAKETRCAPGTPVYTYAVATGQNASTPASNLLCVLAAAHGVRVSLQTVSQGAEGEQTPGVVQGYWLSKELLAEVAASFENEPGAVLTATHNQLGENYAGLFYRDLTPVFLSVAPHAA